MWVFLGFRLFGLGKFCIQALVVPFDVALGLGFLKRIWLLFGEGFEFRALCRQAGCFVCLSSVGAFEILGQIPEASRSLGSVLTDCESQKVDLLCQDVW